MTMPQTQADQNKAIVRRLFEEAFNKRNAGVINELLAANYVNHDFPAPAPGAEGFRQVNALFLTAFPDMHVTFEEELAEGNMVITRGYFTGTHKGEFQGVPPTGKQIKVKYIDIWRVENGKLVENWVQMDQLGLLQQLGVVPTPGQAGV